MKSSVRLLAWSATLPVAVTGGVYAVMAYCMSPADPMDVLNHPWQPDVMHWHLLTAPFWLFAFGVLWQSHIGPKLRAGGRSRRRTGITLFSLSIPMALSGYLLQVSVEQWWRDMWIIVHVGLSLAWSALFVAHVVTRVRPAGPHSGRPPE